MAFPDAQSLRMAGSKEHGVKSPTQIIEAKHSTWIWKSIERFEFYNHRILGSLGQYNPVSINLISC